MERGKAPKIDIIAVHGLNPRSRTDAEHAWHTWRGPDGRLWLEVDLPSHVPDARIFLYQYNATAVYGKDHDTFLGKANELLEAIRVERDKVEDQDETRPIIFLAHSMGGLLVKQALINAQINPRYASIKAATSGLAFFATPHKGGTPRLVNLGKIASRFAITAGLQQGDDVIEVLRKGNMFSSIMEDHWRHLVDNFHVVTFWGGLDKIVPRESACLGLPGVRENVVKLNADHRDVCKFGPGPVDQDNLKLVQSNIKDLYQKALKKTVQTDHPLVPPRSFRGLRPQQITDIIFRSSRIGSLSAEMQSSRH